MAVRGYLDRLSRTTGMALESLVGWFGARGLTPESPGFAQDWARLARQLGLRVEEAILLLRLSFVEAWSPTELPAPVRQRASRSAQSARMSDYDELLVIITSRWDAARRKRLEYAEAVLARIYGESWEDPSDDRQFGESRRPGRRGRQRLE
jgi:hypothetical protein